MNKRLLLSRFKSLIFVLKSSTEYNIDIKGNEVSALDSKYMSKWFKR